MGCRYISATIRLSNYSASTFYVESGWNVIHRKVGQGDGKMLSSYVRPEDVKLLYPDRPLAPAVQHNRFTGRVLRVTPAGTWVTVRLGLATSSPSDVEVALESHLPMRAYRALGLEVGAPVTFSLRIGGITLLPQVSERDGVES
jgi:hypothetical protein